MKKYLQLLIIIIMFIPIFVKAETCDKEKISISSITSFDKSDNVIELEEATARGRNINLNLSMSDVGDYINYKIIVKNDSNEDYELDNNSFNLKSDYINYDLDLDDDSNVLKANSTKVLYLKIEYKNEVPDNKFESDIYNDNNSMVVGLSTDNKITNPNTGVKMFIWIFVIILCLSLITFIILRKKKYVIFIVLFGLIIIIPMSVYALCKIDLTINSKVTIKNNYFYTNVFEIKYKYGESIPEIPANYLNSVSYDGYSNIISSSGMRSFLRLRLINNKISSSQVGLLFNNKVLYLKGGIKDDDLINSELYERNKELIINEFGRSTCEIDSNGFFDDSICTRCINNDDGRTAALVCENGFVAGQHNSPGCEMFNGVFSCYAE